MNSKPLDTPTDDFTEDELLAMDQDEKLARALHVLGSVEAVVRQVGELASSDALSVIRDARMLAWVLSPAGDNEEAEMVVARIMGDGVITTITAAVQAGREIERMAQRYPEIPESAPLDEASASESV